MAGIFAAHTVAKLRSLGWWVNVLRVVLGAGVALAAGAFINKLSSEKTPQVTDWHWTQTTLIAVTLLYVGTWLWSRRFVRPSAARHLVFVQQLGLAIRVLADHMELTPRARADQRDGLVTHIVTNLARTYEDVLSVRVQFFELSGGPDNFRLSSKRTFKAGERPASSGFAYDTPRGKAAIDWLLSDPKEPEYVRDVKKETRSAWAGSGSGYSTYVSAAVVSTTGFHGMLSVDAPTVGSLTTEDKTYVAAAANAIAALYATAPDKT